MQSTLSAHCKPNYSVPKLPVRQPLFVWTCEVYGRTHSRSMTPGAGLLRYYKVRQTRQRPARWWPRPNRTPGQPPSGRADHGPRRRARSGCRFLRIKLINEYYEMVKETAGEKQRLTRSPDRAAIQDFQPVPKRSIPGTHIKK